MTVRQNAIHKFCLSYCETKTQLWTTLYDVYGLHFLPLEISSNNGWVWQWCEKSPLLIQKPHINFKVNCSCEILLQGIKLFLLHLLFITFQFISPWEKGFRIVRGLRRTVLNLINDKVENIYFMLVVSKSSSCTSIYKPNV